MQALQALHQKFHVADAAARELHVQPQVLIAAGLLFVDAGRLGFRNRFDGAEVGGGFVDQRLDMKSEKLGAGPGITRSHPRFDEHVKIPVASSRGVIQLRAFERMADLAQAAIRGGGADRPGSTCLPAGVEVEEGFGDPVGGSFEEFLRAVRTVAFGGAVAGMNKKEVDIGAVVELTAAQLAEGDDGESAARIGVFAGELAAHRAPGDVENGVSEVGDILGGFGEIGETERVAQGDAQHLAAAEQGQIDGAGQAVGGEPGEQLFFVLFFEEATVQVAGGGDLEQPLGIADHGIGQEPAVGKDGERVTEGGRVPGEFARGAGGFAGQAIEEMYGVVRVWQRREQRPDDAQGVRGQIVQPEQFQDAPWPGRESLDLFEETQHYYIV